MLKSFFITFVLIAIYQFNSFAQDKSSIHSLQRAPEDQALRDKIDLAYEKKDWPSYESASKEYIAYAPWSSDGYYNLACAQMVQGNTDDSFVNLEKSVENGFIDLDHLQNDNDFKGSGIKDDKRWIAIIEKIKECVKKNDAKSELYTLFYAGKYDQSLKDTGKYVKNYKMSAEIALLQAMNYAMLNKKDFALKNLNQYATLLDTIYYVPLQETPAFKAYANDATFKVIQAKLTKKALENQKAKKAEEALQKK